MSIAVSTVVYPSRVLVTLVAGMCFGVSFIGIVVGMGWIGNLNLFARVVIAVMCLIVGCCWFFGKMMRRKSLHIDISGAGQIRLAEHNMLAGSNFLDGSPQSQPVGEVVQLMKDSTLWPYLLLLRLQTRDKKTRTLLILPDCVGTESFRALSVACRWVASHNYSNEHKIL